MCRASNFQNEKTPQASWYRHEQGIDGVNMGVYQTLLIISGIFSLILGIAHFFFPSLFDFRSAIPKEGPSLKPFSLMFIQYKTTREDTYGLVWVMNHAASFSIVTVGLLDVLCSRWIFSEYASALLIWITLWWLLRAGSQLYLGRRKGDWAILTGFTFLAALHVVGLFLLQ